MRFCVSGASGRVGGAAVDELRARGHGVVPTDLRSWRGHVQGSGS